MSRYVMSRNLNLGEFNWFNYEFDKIPQDSHV